jgi:Amt family ammonium transporter
LVWLVWFNAGSALAAMQRQQWLCHNNYCFASAMLTACFFDRLNGRKVSALGACIGAVVVCSITPSAGYVTIPQSTSSIIGAIVSNKMVYWKN